MPTIQYHGKEYKRINFKISCDSDLASISHRINEVLIPGLQIEKETFLHSITELIDNSINAHKEKQINSPVILCFSLENEDLVITIRDKGRGFDIMELPYNLDDPVSAIDINGKNFQIYREKSNYRKFGTGLFNAKKTFDSFSLSFLNKDGKLLSYGSHNIEGTLIKVKTKLS